MTSPELAKLSSENQESMPPAEPPPLPSHCNGTQVGKNWWARFFASFRFTGLVSTLLSRVAGGISLLGVFVGAFVLRPTGSDHSVCGLHRTAGIPCPGCGLTRSVTSTLQGHLEWALGFNPFGPFIAGIMVTLALGLLLPRRWRDSLVERLSPYNRVFGWTLMVFVLALFIHGIWRIGMVLGGNPDYEWWSTNSVPPFAQE